MTRNKAQKTDIRQRMAETGEPCSVARRAVTEPGADVTESAADVTDPASAAAEPASAISPASAVPQPSGPAGERAETPEQQYAR